MIVSTFRVIEQERIEKSIEEEFIEMRPIATVLVQHFQLSLTLNELFSIVLDISDCRLNQVHSV
jgi:hypothetical protein